MSLTSHLSNPRDPVRAWIDARFPDIGALVADSRRSLRDATTVCAIDGRPPTTSGMAIDYRIRYAFAVTPPTGAHRLRRRGRRPLEHPSGDSPRAPCALAEGVEEEGRELGQILDPDDGSRTKLRMGCPQA